MTDWDVRTMDPNQVVLQHQPLIKRTFYRSFWPIFRPYEEEFLVDGMTGVWKAWKTYNPERGGFLHWARWHVRNEMRNLAGFLRRVPHDFLGHNRNEDYHFVVSKFVPPRAPICPHCGRVAGVERSVCEACQAAIRRAVKRWGGTGVWADCGHIIRPQSWRIDFPTCKECKKA